MTREITIDALFGRLHAVDKRLENADLQNIQFFLKQEKEIREEVEDIRMNSDQHSQDDLRKINMHWSKLQEYHNTIRKVGGVILKYVMLLEHGWTDNRKIVSISDIEQFVFDCHVAASVDILLDLWDNRMIQTN